MSQKYLIYFGLSIITLIYHYQIQQNISNNIIPNGHVWGCMKGNVSSDLPFCDFNLRIEDRLDDLIQRLTTYEKIGLLGFEEATHVDDCTMMDHGVPRLGIPSYLQLVEVNSGANVKCLQENKCSTNFPGPTGLGATFNKTLWKINGEIMSDELRASNNLNNFRTIEVPYSLVGLNGFGPNINIIRDPRFGRNSELPSEDPYLTGMYAVNYVRGGQGMDDYENGSSKYLKMSMGLKHFALYSVETDRAAFIPNATIKDLWETYLPQYQLGFSQSDADGNLGGNAMATMCSYAGLNSVPSCANDYLLNKVLRQKFNRSEILVASDCGAIENMFEYMKYTKNEVESAAKSMNGGCDIDLGDEIYSPIKNGGKGSIGKAIKHKMISLKRLDESVRRVLNLRFLVGLFDPLEQQPYTKLGLDAVNSTKAHQTTLEAALQSFVLLKNDGQTLPYSRRKKTALIGPHVNSTRDLMSGYNNDQQCFDKSLNCFATIEQWFIQDDKFNNTIVQQGIDIESNDTSRIQAAFDAALTAEQVLLFIGIGSKQEYETNDRMDTSLPGIQEQFSLDLISLCKSKNIPVTVILINGGALAIDPIVSEASAIIEAFYPSVRGPQALSLAIFGEENRWGKLPITLYDKTFIQKFDFLDFNMTKGRTYKYYTDTPLFPFGFGLSYSQFDITCTHTCQIQNNIQIFCSLSSQTRGDEVLMVYHSAGDDIRNKFNHSMPIKELIAFDRVRVELTGDKRQLTFQITENQLGLIDEQGNKQLYAGDHIIQVTNGNYFNYQINIQIFQQKTLDQVPQF